MRKSQDFFHDPYHQKKPPKRRKIESKNPTQSNLHIKPITYKFNLK